MSTDVCLVSMPYASVAAPSIALGLLETYINKFGYRVNSIHANLKFAEKIGLADYEYINNSINEYLLGEWTFSRAAFPDAALSDDDFFDLFIDLTQEKKQALLQVRQQAEQFIEQLVDDILSQSVKVIGCSSTFQQNCASLALLRQLKAKQPNIITMMGGANCEGIMGQTLSEQFPWVDYVFSGECDDVIGGFIDDLLQGKTIDDSNLPYGFIAQKKLASLTVDIGCNKQAPRATMTDMSKVAMPVFDSYFNALHNSSLSANISPGLVAETSRGCWWGAKQHCSFCGLNGSSMEHRAKQPETALKEFATLSNKYDINKFMIVDNILPAEYMTSLLPSLAENKQYSFFYETKANLKKHHVEALANAGIKWIQPGFEGLHDGFLRAIKKGTTAVQNLSALKWCRSYGIRVTWNFLCDIPNDDLAWYEEMAKWLPLVSHLHPPGKEMTQVRFHRFSPYFNEAKDYGLVLAPNQSYQYVYPLTPEKLANIAYFFEKKTNKTRQLYHVDTVFNAKAPALIKMQQLLDDWGAAWSHGPAPVLYLIDKGEQIIVMDTRKVATNMTHVLSGLTAIIYRLCAEPLTKQRLVAKVQTQYPQTCESTIDEQLDKLISDKLLINLSQCFMALAFIAEDTDLLAVKEAPYGHVDLASEVIA